MTQIPSDLNNLPWSRRGFLKTGLSAGGMVLAAPSIIKAQTPSDTLNVALIGVGGITCGQDAVDKLERGAQLVQFYTGLVYRGPELVSECLEAIAGRDHG